MPERYDCIVGTDIGATDVAAVRQRIAEQSGVVGAVEFVPQGTSGYSFTFTLQPPSKLASILGLGQAAARAIAVVYNACVLVTGVSPGAGSVEVVRVRR